MYKALDIFFICFHTILIFFNLFGWIWRPTRKANLISLVITGASWFILGIFYGIGYCPLTDWHWQVLHKLGKYDIPNSYIDYLIERISGFDANAEVVNVCTVLFYFVVLLISLYLNIFKRKNKVSN